MSNDKVMKPLLVQLDEAIIKIDKVISCIESKKNEASRLKLNIVSQILESVSSQLANTLEIERKPIHTKEIEYVEQPKKKKKKGKVGRPKKKEDTKKKDTKKKDTKKKKEKSCPSQQVSSSESSDSESDSGSEN